MELPNLKELNKIIALCRKNGVQVFELGELRITLSESVPVKASKKQINSILSGPDKTTNKGSIQGLNVPDSMPSDEELLFAAVGGPPPEMFEQ